MSRDWDEESSYENAKEMFEKDGVSTLPQRGWIFNSNWMDWNLLKSGLRAHVTWDLGPVGWSIYEGEHVVGGADVELFAGPKEDNFSLAILAAEKKLDEMVAHSTEKGLEERGL